MSNETGQSDVVLAATAAGERLIERAIELRDRLRLAKRMADAGDRQSAADAVNHGHVYLADAVERYEAAMAALRGDLG